MKSRKARDRRWYEKRDRAKAVIATREWRAKHPGRCVGIADEPVLEAFAKSDGFCEICRNAQRPGRRLAVDHDHKTMKFRGLLCDACNLCLGYAGDDPGRLRRMAEYLEQAELG